ncbi:MAG: hypothetical protein IPK53_08270 [bacterium]|nr:hypothetical protein [bacterium]
MWDIVAHFNQPVEILMAGEAPIEAKRGPNRIGIGRIIRVKLPETGLQLVNLGLNCPIVCFVPGQSSLGDT